jgi:hypothetical protein
MEITGPKVSVTISISVLQLIFISISFPLTEIQKGQNGYISISISANGYSLGYMYRSENLEHIHVQLT